MGTQSWQVESEKERLELRARLHERLHRLKGEPNTLIPWASSLTRKGLGLYELW